MSAAAALSLVPCLPLLPLFSFSAADAALFSKLVVLLPLCLPFFAVFCCCISACMDPLLVDLGHFGGKCYLGPMPVQAAARLEALRNYIWVWGV